MRVLNIFVRYKLAPNMHIANNVNLLSPDLQNLFLGISSQRQIIGKIYFGRINKVGFVSFIKH